MFEYKVVKTYMDKKFLMRFSDLDIIIQDYQKGLYSKKEFIRDVIKAFDELKKVLLESKKNK